ncbi:MAG: ribonuclease III [Chloroflexi bacterium]|nr:ribonuclease III [Chloroflexota bacterium]
MRSAAELAQQLDLPFTDLALLEQALVHSSYHHEHPQPTVLPNERLEFLGDAVVSVVFSDALFARYPRDDEGMLTARRAHIVSTRGLARLARRINLGDYLRLGQGAERAGEDRRASVMAGALEAIAAASYLSLGIDITRDWLLRLAAPELAAEPNIRSLKAPKSRLQELSFADSGRAPRYRVVSAEGPDHAKHYVVEVLIDGEVVGTGEGSNRRTAESEAAAAALRLLETRTWTDLAPGMVAHASSPERDLGDPLAGLIGDPPDGVIDDSPDGPLSRA